MRVASSPEEGLQIVRQLMARFASHEGHYLSSEFDEASTREQFVDPFLGALGWDVVDDASQGPLRDVIFHHRIAGDAMTAGEADWDEDLTERELDDRQPRVGIPDYALRTSSQLRFYVEAKKPSVGIDQKAAAYQVKTYGWAERIPVSVLTDFAHLRLFDCRNRPDFERPREGILAEFDLRLNEYEAHWEKLWTTLSRDAVARGSLSRLVGASIPRGWYSIDASFLRDLTAWRQELAHDLLAENPDLNQYELTEASQRILDRLIFIRVVEDRLIEPKILLRKFARVTDSYRKLCQEFRRLDAMYNGQLFSHHFSERLELSDEWFQTLVAQLYPPRSPYRFNVVSADILGAVYERFLGSEVVIGKNGAEVKERPIVRRQGGVYYTPAWVVRHLVETTLGPLTKGRSPDTIFGLRILDPSCGSGSFLLGALDYLICWLENYYTVRPHTDNKLHYLAPDGTRRLRMETKNKILRNCIFGVDLDPGAVEVAQMSLYLRILDLETHASLYQQLRIFHGTILPTLNSNIRCGNSLLSSSQTPVDLLDSEARTRRINPFDWEDRRFGFGEVLEEHGGFDAVVGNPPYTRVQVLREFKPEEARLYEQHYATAREGSYDVAMPFVEKAISLLRPPRQRETGGGRLGYIISRQFTEMDAGRPLRHLLSHGAHVSAITDFGAGMVFDKVGAYTLLLQLTKGRSDTWQLCRVPPPPSGDALAEALVIPGLNSAMTAASLGDHPWTLSLPREQAILGRLAANYTTLGEVSGGHIFQGVPTGADFIFRCVDLGPDPVNASSHRLVRPRIAPADSPPLSLECAMLRPIFAGREDISPFRTRPSREWLILPYVLNEHTCRYELLSLAALSERAPGIANWLKLNENALRQRAKIGPVWHGYSRRQNLELFVSDKIMVPYMVNRLCATFDRGGHFFVNVSTGGYSILVEPQSDVSLDYLTALLNSELLSWALRRYSRAWRGGWFAARKGNLEPLPVAKVAPYDQQSIVDAYASCCEAASRVDDTKQGSADRELHDRLLATRIDEFDKLVFETYGVTGSEVSVIRSAQRGS